MKQETIILNEERNVTLTPYILDCGKEFNFTPKRPVMLVIPGGAYTYCSAREGEPVAIAYNSAGYHAFVLRYSIDGHFCWPRPVEDYENAMRYILSKAEEYNLDTDHISVIGFSAGGHLASYVSVASKYKPFAAILGYPVTMENVPVIQEDKIPATVNMVRSDMPPVFLFGSRGDKLVKAEDIMRYALALSKCGAEFECHLYSYGDHGFVLGTKEMIGDGKDYCSRVGDWFAESVSWLDELAEKRHVPTISGQRRDKATPFLSVLNSLGYILEHEEGKKVIEEYFKGATFTSKELDDTLIHYEELHSVPLNIRDEIFCKIEKIADKTFSMAELLSQVI